MLRGETWLIGQVQERLSCGTADAETQVPPRQVLDEIERRVQLTPYELSVDGSGMQRW